MPGCTITASPRRRSVLSPGLQRTPRLARTSKGLSPYQQELLQDELHTAKLLQQQRAFGLPAPPPQNLFLPEPPTSGPLSPVDEPAKKEHPKQELSPFVEAFNRHAQSAPPASPPPTATETATANLSLEPAAASPVAISSCGHTTWTSATWSLAVTKSRSRDDCLTAIARHRSQRSRSLDENEAWDSPAESPGAPVPRRALLEKGPYSASSERLLRKAGMLSNNSSPTCRFEITPPAGRVYDFYLIHCQESGQDQCSHLATLLKNAGASVWYDMEASDLTVSGMEQAISQSRSVILFLSKGVMSRPFCHSEMRWAKQYGCGIVGVKEPDCRHGAPDFKHEKESAPQDLVHLLDDVEFIDYRRRGFEQKAMLPEILKRGDIMVAAALDGDASLITKTPRQRRRLSVVEQEISELKSTIAPARDCNTAVTPRSAALTQMAATLQQMAVEFSELKKSVSLQLQPGAVSQGSKIKTAALKLKRRHSFSRNVRAMRAAASSSKAKPRAVTT